MSFYFVGAGARDDVIRQVRSHHLEGGLAHNTRELIVDFLRQDKTDEFVYTVEVNGHDAAGGGASILSISLKAFYAPRGWRHAELGEEHVQAPSLMQIQQAEALAQAALADPELRGRLADAAIGIAQQAAANNVDLGIGLPAEAGE